MHKLRALFTHRELVRLGGLLAAMLVMALLEVVGIASILPFMSLVARPEAIQDNVWLNRIYETFGFTSIQSMLIASGVIVLVLLTLANAFSAFTTWLQYKFAWNTAHSLATRLVRTYLTQPYAFFLHSNTSDLIKRTLAEVNNLVNGVLLTSTDLVARTLVTLVIFALLMAVEPVLSLVVFGVLGGVYTLVYLSRRSYLAGLGQERLDANGRRFRTLYEALTGIKTVKTQAAQGYFYDRFAVASYRLTRIYPNYHLVAQMPRYAVETLAFGGILTITLYLLATEQNMQAALPILSLYALAGYRLLPSLQRIFVATAQLRHTYPVVEEFYEELRGTSPHVEPLPPAPPALAFTDRITLDHLSFRYEGGDRPVVHDVDAVIPKGLSVAFVGSTGSGKTTLVDLVMGLLTPTAGRILIDGEPLEGETVARWHRTVGYVPQDVFLYDDTVARNIAFGVPEDAVDPARIREVAQVAQAHRFIEAELPDGYDTPIGERGVRLSGGQRQRLGLARALYHNPQVLLLDEATSALDGITEEAIIRAVRAYAADLTMIMIAHRLSTVKHSDCIYLLDNGRIVQQGTFDDLFDSNPMFRRMAELTS